jgi:RNA polymerase sigma-70 factor (family 1)
LYGIRKTSLHGVFTPKSTLTPVPSEIIHNEKDLLREIAQGDRKAFGVLYKYYFPTVRHYVALFEPSGTMLDELTQDVFVRIWEKRSKLAAVDSFKNYLFLVTRNVVFNYIRALKVLKAKQQSAGPEAAEGIAGGSDPESELLFKQYYHMALEAIDKLPEGRRKILQMSIDRGLSLDEIAAELNISRAGVKKQLYAATAFVRQYLQENGKMGLG